MPGVSQIVFGAKNLERSEVSGRQIIDVGACDFNGSIRPLVESWKPARYVGVDIIPGPSVDVQCSADDLVERFGKDSFDVVLCIEMLEHSRDWKRSIHNMKEILKPEGVMLLTTRSVGYPCHGFPHDYWRFELQDMREIFSDFEILALESDYSNPGVFIKARKPAAFREKTLSTFKTYSMLVNDRIAEVSESCFKHPYFKRLALKQRIRNFVNESVIRIGRIVSKLLRI